MFDPTQKVSPPVLESQAKKILKSGVFEKLLQSAPNIIMILNEQRQVVYLNRHPVSQYDYENTTGVGQRPGECLGCVNAPRGELGCSSSEFCRVCGFNAAITASQRGSEGQDECNIALTNGSSLTLSVSTRPFAFEGETYIFCTLENISEKKRRQMLESIFLHDILNTAAILRGLSETFEELPREQVKDMLNEVSGNITDEVQSYRLISNAESQLLKPDYSLLDISDIIAEVVRSLQSMHRYKFRQVEMDVSVANIVTERTLLRRVLMNMIKNALEASNQDDVVRIYAHYDKNEEVARISVENPQVIPQNDQLKLFQKSFSTKGRGRGWGTYSIKILTEKYLNGSVSFVSEKGKGTIFTIEIPSLSESGS